MGTFDLFKRLFGGGGTPEQERREKPRVNAREGTRVFSRPAPRKLVHAV